MNFLAIFGSYNCRLSQIWPVFKMKKPEIAVLKIVTGGKEQSENRKFS